MLGLLCVAIFVSAPEARAAEGQSLYEERCSSCHGLNARGVPGVGPSLLDSGEAAIDFELSTGRMPMTEEPGEQPSRKEPAFDQAQIDAIVEYLTALPDASAEPRAPDVDPGRGDVARGLGTFTSFCAGCHQVVGRGGVVVQALAPALDDATPEQIGEAVRVGPYVMPAFGEETIDAQSLDDVAAYIRYARDPEDEGGWSLGHLGPIPEGMVAWLVGAAALVAVARLLGESGP